MKQADPDWLDGLETALKARGLDFVDFIQVGLVYFQMKQLHLEAGFSEGEANDKALTAALIFASSKAIRGAVAPKLGQLLQGKKWVPHLRKYLIDTPVSVAGWALLTDAGVGEVAEAVGEVGAAAVHKVDTALGGILSGRSPQEAPQYPNRGGMVRRRGIMRY